MKTKKMLDYDPNNITDDVLDLMAEYCGRTSFSLFKHTKNRVNALSAQNNVHPIFIIDYALTLLEEQIKSDPNDFIIRNAEFMKQINDFRIVLKQHKRRY